MGQLQRWKNQLTHCRLTTKGRLFFTGQQILCFKDQYYIFFILVPAVNPLSSQHQFLCDFLLLKEQSQLKMKEIIVQWNHTYKI